MTGTPGEILRNNYGVNTETLDRKGQGTVPGAWDLACTAPGDGRTCRWPRIDMRGNNGKEFAGQRQGEGDVRKHSDLGLRPCEVVEDSMVQRPLVCGEGLGSNNHQVEVHSTLETGHAYAHADNQSPAEVAVEATAFCYEPPTLISLA